MLSRAIFTAREYKGMKSVDGGCSFPTALYINLAARYGNPCRSGSRGGRKKALEESRDITGQGGRGIDPGKPAGKCNRKQTADGAVPRERLTGKVETVR